MVDAQTGEATYINQNESYAHLTYYRGYVLQLVVGEAIKAIKIMRGSLDVAFELNILVSKVVEYYLHCFYQASEIVVNYICNIFQQKDHIENFQKMKILLLKPFPGKGFDNELHQMSSYLIRDPTENFDRYCC